MVIFQDIQDVQDWLEPLEYNVFWEAVAPYAVFSEDDREHCDQLIAAGKVSTRTILRALKYIARDGIRDRFGLERRHYRHLAGNAGGLLH